MNKFLILCYVFITCTHSLYAKNSSLGDTLSYGGFQTDIEVVGNYTYVASTSELKIFDTSNPKVPIQIGRRYFIDKIHEICLHENYVYVATGTNLEIFNIIDPARPTYIGKVVRKDYQPDFPYDITFSDNHIFIATSKAIEIYDVSNKYVPLKTSGLVVNHKSPKVSKIAVKGNYLYALNSDGVNVIDISDLPALAKKVLTYDMQVPSIGTFLYMSKNNIFTNDAKNGLIKLDITNPVDTKLVGNYQSNNYILDVHIKDNQAYLLTLEEQANHPTIINQTIELINIEQLSSVSHIESFIMPITFNNLSIQGNRFDNLIIQGNYAYFIGSAFSTVNISNLSAVKLESYYPGINASEVKIVEDYAYISNSANGLNIIDIKNPITPLSVGHFYIDNLNAGHARYIDVVGSYAYLSAGRSGLYIIDISNPSLPTLTGRYTLSSGSAGPIEVVGNYAYLYVAGSIHIIDIVDPTSPIGINSYSHSNSQINNMKIFDDIMYVTDYKNFSTVDISNKSAPTLIGRHAIDNCEYFVSSLEIDLNKKHAYVVCDYGLSILDINIPTSPSIIDHYKFSYSGEMNIVDDIAYVANGLFGLSLFDISIPSSVKLITTYDTSYNAQRVTIHDAYAFVSDEGGGVAIINIKDTSLIDIEKFVTRFYENILDRAPDDAGLKYWVNKLASRSGVGADIAKGFIFSAEFIGRGFTDEQYVNVLYAAFFDRPADAGGLAGWLAILSASTDNTRARAEVLDGFLGSLEFKNLADSYGIIAIETLTPVEQFVTRFYEQTLERTPDDAGLADWSNRLNSGAASGSDIAFGFVFSAEFTARELNNTEYLNVLYRAFFAREADTAGFNGWKAQLDAGTTREDVLQGFLGAVEFSNLAVSYGIRVR